MKNGCLWLICIYIFIYTISFVITAAVGWLVCWAFSLVFNWKIIFGIWLLLCFLIPMFRPQVNIKK